MNREIKKLVESFFNDEEEQNDIDVKIQRKVVYDEIIDPTLDFNSDNYSKINSQQYFDIIEIYETYGLRYKVRNKTDLAIILVCLLDFKNEKSFTLKWLDLSNINDISKMFSNTRIINVNWLKDLDI